MFIEIDDGQLCTGSVCEGTVNRSKQVRIEFSHQIFAFVSCPIYVALFVALLLGFFRNSLFMLCCKSSVGDHKNVAVWSSIDQFLHGVSLRVFALKNARDEREGHLRSDFN